VKADVNTRIIIGFHERRIPGLREGKLIYLTTPYHKVTYIVIISPIK
jgi:hypothetical protein